MPEEDPPQDPKLSMEIDGKRQIIRLMDFRGTDDRLLRNEIGMTVHEAWQEMSKGALDATAGLLWLMRRRSEPNLTFEEVNSSISFREYLSVRDGAIDEMENERAEFDGREPEAVSADPQA
jgi:hypothetical protein